MDAETLVDWLIIGVLALLPLAAVFVVADFCIFFWRHRVKRRS